MLLYVYNTQYISLVGLARRPCNFEQDPQYGHRFNREINKKNPYLLYVSPTLYRVSLIGKCVWPDTQKFARSIMVLHTGTILVDNSVHLTCIYVQDSCETMETRQSEYYYFSYLYIKEGEKSKSKIILQFPCVFCLLFIYPRFVIDVLHDTS